MVIKRDVSRVRSSHPQRDGTLIRTASTTGRWEVSAVSRAVSSRIARAHNVRSEHSQCQVIISLKNVLGQNPSTAARDEEVSSWLKGRRRFVDELLGRSTAYQDYY